MKQIMAQEAFNLLKPELIFFVVSHNTSGKSNIMTCSWMTKCSHEPPMIAVAIAKEQLTLKNIRATKEFVVSFPGKDLEKMITYFGSAHGDKVDKVTESKIKLEKSVYLGVPLPSDAAINLECVLVSETDAGDHVLLVAKLLTSHHNEGKKVLAGLKGAHGSRAYQEF
jgi:flavin reductase (DIM6/NTAB) family NADH-FMN oxidoreductase RutF